MRILIPVPSDRLWRRTSQLAVGLLLYGVSLAMQVRASLGLSPWDVFHQGLARLLPLSFGTVVIVVGAVVLLLWWPLRQRPGPGTLANVVVVGLAVDLTLAVLPGDPHLAVRVPLLLAGIGLNALAGALYIGAGLGPGPRDGLMTGLVARTGRSIRVVRTAIEVSVLVAGWLLGGGVGIGTVLYAVSVGPLLHVLLPRLTVRSAAVNPLDGRAPPAGRTA